jgi:hypothetical protein
VRSALLFLNIAPQTLDLDADDDWLLRAVTEAGIEPGRVVVEITERFGGRTVSVLRSLRRLRAQGFKGRARRRRHRQRGARDAPRGRRRAGGGQRARRAARHGDVRVPDRRVRHRRGIEDDALLHYVRTIDAIPREAATMIQGGQGYGLGRPAATVPADGATLDALAPSA